MSPTQNTEMVRVQDADEPGVAITLARSEILRTRTDNALETSYENLVSACKLPYAVSRL